MISQTFPHGRQDLLCGGKAAREPAADRELRDLDDVRVAEPEVDVQRPRDRLARGVGVAGRFRRRQPERDRASGFFLGSFCCTFDSPNVANFCQSVGCSELAPFSAVSEARFARERTVDDVALHHGACQGDANPEEVVPSTGREISRG